MKQLVLENSSGQVARIFPWDGQAVQVVVRKDTSRVELHRDTEGLKQKKIPFHLVGQVDASTLENNQFSIGGLGHLKLVDKIDQIIEDPIENEDNVKLLTLICLFIIGMNVLFMVLMRSIPQNTAKIEEELQQQVVKIVQKKTPPKVNNVSANVSQTNNQSVTKKTTNLKRMGALAVFGSMKSSNQKGGVDVHAVQSSAGPGLGGLQGSGGTQTALYGKGILSAPLGAGGNLQGAGGYGTKGKGGGQAGYGKMSLVGANGSESIPLSNEAEVGGGLDLDLVAEVIKKNLGQIRFCYEQGLQSEPSLSGKVTVEFVIGGSGQVKTAGVKNSSLGSQTVDECILSRLRSWRFALPEGGSDVKVVYPFSFKRAGQG